jgi:hypothetical protein
MSGFSAEWLVLREPYDTRARNVAVRDAALAQLAGHSSVTIVDLACGTGSTVRALSPHLHGTRQNWRLFDNNLSLLARAVPPASENVNATPIPLDLSLDLEAALDGPIDLVTTSALLDLVSDDWLERLVMEIAARNLPFYAALTYDGRIEFDPTEDADAAVVASVNRHQHGHKGFGPALGPSAVNIAVARFEAVGYTVKQGKADWMFGPVDRPIQNEVLAGWAFAARDIDDPPIMVIEDWLTRRRAAVAAGHSSIRVGHVDFFACPTGTR